MGLESDPHAHALSLGLAIASNALPQGWRGAYSHPHRTIYLVKGMSEREYRCTLAHEIQHAIAGDYLTDLGFINDRQEKLARKRTAKCLIDFKEYSAAEARFGFHLASIAQELQVTTSVLKDWRNWYLHKHQLDIDAGRV